MASTIPLVNPGQKESKRLSQKTVTPMMGKSRKFSKGNSTGFVPDSRHGVDTMAQSEGFGSSVRLDTVITLSEDSCPSKRKRVIVNSDSYEHLGLPLQLLSLPSMSKLEKKELERRLKRELEQVRLLQKRISSLNTNTAVLSSTTDNRSSDWKNRLALEKGRRQRPPPGKKRGTSSLGQMHPVANKGMPGRAPPVKQAVLPLSSNAALMKQCAGLLEQLMGHQMAKGFCEPVDVVKYNIPDYYSVIKQPMDLGTVKKKLSAGEYSSPVDFAEDVRLTFSNAMAYNPPKNQFHEMAKALGRFFDARWKNIERKIPRMADVQLAPLNRDALLENDVSSWVPPLKKKKIQSADSNVAPEPVKMVMTAQERAKLSIELQDALEDMPEDIIIFLKENSPNAAQTAEDEIEIDIEEFSDDTMIKLRKLLNEYFEEKKRKQTKAEPCRMELHNESGFSNSLIQLHKGNDIVDEDIDTGGEDPQALSIPSVKFDKDTAKQNLKCRSPSKSSCGSGSRLSGNDVFDEDIDIGGNDPPVSSCPPVEIEKDIANRSGKCSTSSTSSSGSGSSSSDTDTGSSSSSESENEDALLPAKEKMIVDANTCGTHKNQDGASDQSRTYLCRAGLDAQNNATSGEVADHKEGKGAASERQFSPEKLYRAALLRSRFADTILKAEEKKLEKGDKRDPEKLQRDREELERRQREEKARLQAEAKAAEEARKKAAAAAAAEAKRKREMEREAARIALQKMEKTVDINDNCQFLEGLLGSAPPDNSSAFIGDSIPINTKNSIGGFKFHGSNNPLEQLGLFIKADEDDDEEETVVATQRAVDAEDNIEEGEID